MQFPHNVLDDVAPQKGVLRRVNCIGVRTHRKKHPFHIWVFHKCFANPAKPDVDHLPREHIQTRITSIPF